MEVLLASQEVATNGLFNLFVAGTFWFWALIIAEMVLLFVFVNYENGVGALVSLIAFACCLQFFGDTDLWKLVSENPLWTGVILAGYLLLSVPWGVFRWAMFCRDKLEDYEDKKADFLRKKGQPNAKVVPVEFREEWKQYVANTKDYHTGQTIADPPLARQHKGFITRAMALWVIDAVWWILGDMCVRIWKTIYNRIAGMLQHISDSMFSKSKISDDLDSPGAEE